MHKIIVINMYFVSKDSGYQQPLLALKCTTDSSEQSLPGIVTANLNAYPMGYCVGFLRP